MKPFQYASLFTLCMVVIFSFHPVSGQIGFNFYNERNHPELRWQVLETSHFKIIFHQRLETQAMNAANIAETCFESLTANLKHTPQQKIPIYLSDQDAIPNGFDVSNRYIAIWINANRYIKHTTGTDKWLRKVIAHELVHYLHFSKISTWSGFLGHAFTGTPRWFIEGLAQYESETWNVHRGDLVLRTRVLEDEMDYSGFQAPTDGKMLYASGNSAVRYLAQTYGDSKLLALLEHRSQFILPYYDFANAFKHVLGKSSGAFLKEWRKQVNIYYNSVYAQKEEIFDFAERIQLPFQFIRDYKISPDSTRLAVVGIVSMNEPVSRLYLLDAVQGRIIKTLDYNRVLAGIDFSPDGRQLVYAKYHRGQNGSLIPDVLITDLNGKKQWVTQNKRARMPVWTKDGKKILCIVNQNGTDNLFVFTPENPNGQQLTTFFGDTQLSSPRLSPDGQWIAFMLADSSGHRNLSVFSPNQKQLWQVTNDSIDQRNPVWSSDSKRLAFTSYRTGIPNIFLKNLATNKPQNWRQIPAQQVTDAAMGLYLADWQQDSLVALVLESKQSQQVFRLPANRNVAESKIQIKPRYEAWQSHQPPFGIPGFQATRTARIEKKYNYNSFRAINHYFTIPLPLIDESRRGLSFISYWAEPLAKHNLVAFGDIALNEPSLSRYVVSYLNNQWHPTVAFSAFHYPLEAQFFADELLITEKKGINLTGWLPFNSGDDLYSNHTFMTRFSLFKNHPQYLEQFRDKWLKPESHRMSEFSVGYRWNSRRPHRWNIIHPLAANGFRIKMSFADKKWGSEINYRKYELDSYRHHSVPWGAHVVYARLLLQAVQGTLPQQYQLGFDKYDQLDFGLGLPLGDRPRLRGENEYHFGNRVIFGNLEYRFPLIRHLNWYLAGFSFGQVTGCGFVDFGAVWDSRETSFRTVSLLKTAGFELKNKVTAGMFTFVHELGLAQKLNHASEEFEFYYRIRSVVPF